MNGKLAVLATTGAMTAAAGLAGTGVANAATLPAHNTHRGAAGPAVKTFKTAVHPDSASGCNKQTCIFVWGNGRHVSYWSTTGSDTFAYRCTQPGFWVGGIVAFYGSLYCSSNDFYYSLGLSNYNFTGTGNLQICNTWVNGPAGHPCETVKRGS
jgi:hypothetical protein